MSVVANVAIEVDAANAIQQLNRVRDAAKKVNGELNKTPQNTEKTKNSFKDVSSAIVGLTAKLTAGYTAAKLFADSLGTFFSRSQAEQQLKNLTSSTEEYNVALALAEKQVQMFGISQTEATKAIADVYSKLSGVGYGLKEIGEIYQGFNVIVTQTGVASQDAAGAFFQLSQALAKGKLNGDEFVTISERMPQLLNAISENTGIARGQFKEMAEQGKLTGQLIYQALAQASQGAGDLNRFLTGQAVAMSNLKVAADRVFYVIGALFGPVVTAATQGFADLLGEVEKAVIANYGMFKQFLGVLMAIAKAVLPAIGAGFEFVFRNIKQILQTITFFGTFIGILKGIVLATQAWTAATQALATAKKVAALAATALQVIMNPAALGKIAVAIAGAAAASYALGKAMDEAAKQISQVNNETKLTDNEITELVKKYSSLPPVIVDTKQKANKLKEAQKGVTEQIQQSSKAADELQSRLTTDVENQLKITQARFEAEKAVNDVLIQQYQNLLDAAATEEDRRRIAEEIYSLTVQNAELELRATQAAIAAEVEKARIVASTAAAKERELTATVQMAIAQGTVTKEHFEALNAQREAVQIAFDNLDTTKQIANEQYRVADAVYKGKVEAAGAAYQQNIVAKNSGNAADEAGRFADNMERGAGSASKAAQSMQQMGQSGQGGSMLITGPAAQNKAFMSEFYGAIQQLTELRTGLIKSENEYWRVVREFQDRAEAYNKAKAKEEMDRAREEWDRTLIYGQKSKSLFASVDAAHQSMATSIEATNTRIMQSFKETANTASNTTPKFASGGYVTGPTKALIGEGGEPEYVIPSSKMASAMANYAAGRRGSAVLSPQVNITTGPVTQMDGTNYVTMGDLRQATSAAARQGANLALSQLQSNPSLRRSIGVSR